MQIALQLSPGVRIEGDGSLTYLVLIQNVGPATGFFNLCLTLSGTNETIIQTIFPDVDNAISVGSPYTSMCIGLVTADLAREPAPLIPSTLQGSAPTWTLGSTQAVLKNAIAIKGN